MFMFRLLNRVKMNLESLSYSQQALMIQLKYKVTEVKLSIRVIYFAFLF